MPSSSSISQNDLDMKNRKREVKGGATPTATASIDPGRDYPIAEEKEKIRDILEKD